MRDNQLLNLNFIIFFYFSFVLIMHFFILNFFNFNEERYKAKLLSFLSFLTYIIIIE